MKIFCLILIFAVTVSSVSASEISNNAELCEQFQKAKQQVKDQGLPGLTSARFKLMLQMIFPSLSYKLASIGITSGYSDKVSQGRHVIVSFGVPSQDKELKAKFQATNAHFKEQMKIFLRLYKQKTIQSCLSKAKAEEFNVDFFFKLRDDLANMTTVQRDVEYNEVLKRYRKLPSSLQQQWELKTAFHLADLKALLNSNSIDHLIIVAHANDKGHMTDGFGNYLPNGYFDGISSKLKSLSFFTCHGKKVVESFKLEKAQAQLKIFYPESKSPLLSDVSILKALPSFVKKVSKKLNGISIRKSKPEDECSLEITQGKVQGGEVAILLGDKYYLGHASEKGNRSFAFNCSLLKSETLVNIRSLQLKSSLKLIQEWKFLLHTQSSVKELELLEDFESDGVYTGSLFQL